MLEKGAWVTVLIVLLTGHGSDTTRPFHRSPNVEKCEI